MSIAITPETKLHDLFEAYPGLEEKLLSMSPQFGELHNPALRATVAKVANLRQVAEVAGLPLGELINTLRASAGQEASDLPTSAEPDDRPGWLINDKVTMRLDARSLLAAGEHPLNRVLSEIQNLQHGEIYELTTPFLPAPLIDVMKKKGFSSWSAHDAGGLYRSYFCKVSES